jgi:hypothetical protein
MLAQAVSGAYFNSDACAEIPGIPRIFCRVSDNLMARRTPPLLCRIAGFLAQL